MSQLSGFVARYNIKQEHLLKFRDIGEKAAILVFSAYMVASVTGAALVSLLWNKTGAPSAVGKMEAKEQYLNFKSPSNSRETKKIILARNIFNSEGKFPDEKDPEDGGESVGRSFDINAACQKPSSNVELLGTIFSERSQDSLATMKEKDYGEADIYRVGDTLIGNDKASIVAIERQRVIVNNNGSKECYELAAASPEILAQMAPSGGAAERAPTFSPAGANDGGAVVLQASYVEQQLGQGFQNIITKARLVPNTEGTKVNGFRIFAIDPGSLFSKVGLSNNDLIMQVNDSSLQQAEQGFALFEALQNEKTIRLNILRDNQPKNITIQIK